MDAKVTVSVGGAVWDPRSKPAQDFAQVLDRAGAALAKARALGKGTIEVDGAPSPG
jgi:GGDEF domain-containing protein